MEKFPKTDSEFEALFELVYKRKIDASQLTELRKQMIFDQMKSKRYVGQPKELLIQKIPEVLSIPIITSLIKDMEMLRIST